MASLRGRAKHRLFAAKRRVNLGKLSPGDAVLIALTAVRASHENFHARAKDLVTAGEYPTAPEFSRLMAQVLNRRRGSFYAAVVTSIDHKKVFRADHFAVSLKRLGIFDDIESVVGRMGHQNFAHTVSTYGPWYWSDLVSTELKNVKRDTYSPVQRALAIFTEDFKPLDMDELIETTLTGTTPTTPRAAMALGISHFTVGGGSQQSFMQAFRGIIRTPNIEILDQNSTIDAILSTFYEHLLSDPNILRRVLPQAQYKGVGLSPSQLYQVFQTTRVRRGLFKSFKYGYDRSSHSIRMAALYRGIEQYKMKDRLVDAVRQRTGKILDEAGAAAIVTSIIGLFYAFVADKKGQMFPIMKTIAG